MAKLKLGTIADDRPVKLTVELSAALHRDLVAYGHALARETGPRRGRACKAGRADAGACQYRVNFPHLCRSKIPQLSISRPADRAVILAVVPGVAGWLPGMVS